MLNNTIPVCLQLSIRRAGALTLSTGFIAWEFSQNDECFCQLAFVQFKRYLLYSLCCWFRLQCFYAQIEIGHFLGLSLKFRIFFMIGDFSILRH